MNEYLTEGTRIWEFAQMSENPDSLLAYAAERFKRWSKSPQVEFIDSKEIMIASVLLMDDLLPVSAREALAATMIDTIVEATNSKVRIDTLKITPPAPGRKPCGEKFERLVEVVGLIDQGLSKKESYEKAARKFNKSPQTPRRDYERLAKKIRDRKERGN